jgi:hypothetical protein
LCVNYSQWKKAAVTTPAEYPRLFGAQPQGNETGRSDVQDHNALFTPAPSSAGASSALACSRPLAATSMPSPFGHFATPGGGGTAAAATAGTGSGPTPQPISDLINQHGGFGRTIPDLIDQIQDAIHSTGQNGFLGQNGGFDRTIPDLIDQIQDAIHSIGQSGLGQNGGFGSMAVPILDENQKKKRRLEESIASRRTRLERLQQTFTFKRTNNFSTATTIAQMVRVEISLGNDEEELEKLL